MSTQHCILNGTNLSPSVLTIYIYTCLYVYVIILKDIYLNEAFEHRTRITGRPKCTDVSRIGLQLLYND